MASDSGLENNLALSEASAAFEQGDIDRAATICSKMVDKGANSSRLYGLLGRIYHATGRAEFASKMFRKSLDLDQHNSETIFHLSAFLEEYGDFEEALKAYRYALTYDSGYADRRVNRALHFFRNNDLELGWREYEFRSTLEKPGAWVDRFWDGSDISNKTILVIGEQGIGDQIMFATCLPELIKIAGHVIIEPDARLVPMFHRTFPDCTVVGERYFRSDSDRQQKEVDEIVADTAVMMGSVPRFFRQTLEHFPAQAPQVLVPDPDTVERLHKGLPRREGVSKIGISWRSLFPTDNRSSKYPPLESWAPLFENTDATFVSLQANLNDTERKMFRDCFNVELIEVDNVDLIDDVESTISLIASLDSVVSAKSYIAWFSAGAGGRIWRVNTGTRSDDPWLFGTQNLCWFPHMTVLCEHNDGGFEAIFRRIADDLLQQP